MTEEVKEFEILPTDVVKVRALEAGFSVDESKEEGDIFDMPGKFFQNGTPSWVEIISVHEPEIKTVQQVVAGKQKSKAK